MYVQTHNVNKKDACSLAAMGPSLIFRASLKWLSEELQANCRFIVLVDTKDIITSGIDYVTDLTKLTTTLACYCAC